MTTESRTTCSSTRTQTADFILREALALGIRVGTDGCDELVMVAPARVPSDVRRWFETELYKYKPEIIEVILSITKAT
jgi:hypothetical protein